MEKNKYQRASKSTKKEVAKEFFNTDYGHNIKVRLNRLLVYGVALFGFSIFFLIDGIMDNNNNNNISKIVLGIISGLFAILFLGGRYYAKVKQCNAYMINNPKKTSKKKK